jgi:hypothetical protein
MPKEKPTEAKPGASPPPEETRTPSSRITTTVSADGLTGSVEITPEPAEKHPRDMTTEEALDHLFHPEIAKAVRKAVQEPEDEESE